MKVLITVLCLYVVKNVQSQYYTIPDILIEALKPRGLRVSIPDEDGIQLFAFHGKINEKMKGREAGVFSVDIRQAENGRWTFYNKGARLKVGDVLYYWVHVNYDGIGYEKDGVPFTVNALVDPDGQTDGDTSNLTCKQPQTKFSNESICKGALIFEDNFEKFDRSKWKPEVKFAYGPDYEFVIYRDDVRNLYIKNRALHIKPVTTEDVYGPKSVRNRLDLGSSCTGTLPLQCALSPKGANILPPVTSAQISTVDSFKFTYGIIEVKAKLPKGDWLYPEINLVPRGEVYGPDYASGRIRIAFLHGNSEFNHDLYAGCKMGNWDSARNYTMKKIYSDSPWTDDYHVFRVEWNPDGIILKVDNSVFGTIYPPAGGFASDQHLIQVDSSITERWKKGTVLAPFDQEMYIMLGVGAGGHVFSDNIDHKPWDNGDPKQQLRFYQNQREWKRSWSSASKLTVQYVKVWSV